MGVVIIYMLVLLGAFFVFIVLPQRRRMQAHRALIAALAVDDEVVTNGGLHGTIRVLDDSVVELEIAPGVVVKVARGAISARVAQVAADDGEAA
jgi:preprotein translocase subunit YajC